MTESCWECLRAERHEGVWPFYESECRGCEKRALATSTQPKPAEPDATKEDACTAAAAEVTNRAPSAQKD